jgi:hypothetical protein
MKTIKKILGIYKEKPSSEDLPIEKGKEHRCNRGGSDIYAWSCQKRKDTNVWECVVHWDCKCKGGEKPRRAYRESHQFLTEGNGKCWLVGQGVVFGEHGSEEDDHWYRVGRSPTFQREEEYRTLSEPTSVGTMPRTTSLEGIPSGERRKKAALFNTTEEITLKVSKREMDILQAVLFSVGGNPEGPRKGITRICDLLGFTMDRYNNRKIRRSLDISHLPRSWLDIYTD